MPTISTKIVILFLMTVLLIALHVMTSGHDEHNSRTTQTAASNSALGLTPVAVFDVALDPSSNNIPPLTTRTKSADQSASHADAAPFAASDPIRYSAGDAPSLTIKPHIVFILADDMGWNDVGYHGSKIKTPFMDNLAMTGLRLENYYVQHVCSPSRASLMSGLYQSHTGIDRIIEWAEQGCLPLHLPIIPESLRQNGYSTHLVGKWHLGMSRNACLPLARGFDTFLGFYGGSEDHYTHYNAKQATNEQFFVSGYDFRDNDRVAREYKGQYSTNIFATRAENIIAQHGQNKKPLFLFLSMQAPHLPLQAPIQYIKQNTAIKSQFRKRRRFAGMITCMDEAIRRVTLALNKHGLRNNTVIIFSSDNGGETVASGANNEPLRGKKGQFFEGGIRVVGFVNSPLLSPIVRGTEYKGLMGAADWYPTLVEGVAGGKMGTIQTDGYDMWNALRFGTASPRTEYLHSVGGDCEWNPEFPFNSTDLSNKPRMYGTLRVGSWKLIVDWNKPDSEEAALLFDLEHDPYEENNILESNQDIFKKLVDRLKYHCRTHVQYVPLMEDENADPRKRNGVFGPWL